ncbi:uncharacterized protein LOC120073506 [Benincasa hispida]|uniref:uncharacterized protein LOC120073506 n=1 Tax=Benincasa hispida TaxID=102211 RepID=UPI00190050DA|nr:uncharacterized protein LOC120073506 [Benincasa hispida]
MAEEQQNQQLAHAAQNPILMANNSMRPIREYTSPVLYDFTPRIVYPTPNGTRFEMKFVMLQMLKTAGKFGGSRGEYPHAHMKRFLETCNSFVIPGITPEEKLVEKFMQKYFPPTTNVRRRLEIMNFEQEDTGTLSAAWEHFKGLVKNCPNHGLLLTIQMETFYGRLNRASQMAVDAAAARGLMEKSYTEAKEILDRIAKHNMEWVDDTYDGRNDRRRRSQNINSVDANAIATLSAQVATLTSLLQNITLGNAPNQQKVNQVEAFGQPMVTCVGCGDFHSYAQCLQNLQSVCFIKNNPFSNTYNPGWRNHPNFSWIRGNQQEHHPSASHQQRNGPSPVFQQTHQQHQQPFNRGGHASSSGTPLENLLKEYISQNDAMLKSQVSSIRNLEIQVG